MGENEENSEVDRKSDSGGEDVNDGEELNGGVEIGEGDRTRDEVEEDAGRVRGPPIRMQDIMLLGKDNLKMKQTWY